MAWNLICNPARFLREVHRQTAFTLELHKVLTDVVRMIGYSFRIFSGQQIRILSFYHETTTGSRNDDIIALVDPGSQRSDIAFRGRHHRRRIADIERRHPTTGLVRQGHLDTVLLQHLHRRFADISSLIVDQTTGEQCHLFARRADIEGYPDVGGLFRDTSEAETGHAFGHLDFLKEVGDPATGVPIGNTEANLKSAIEGETYEYTQMYPGMAKTARDEGFSELAEWFETLAKAERSHANRFTKGLDSLKQ